MHPLAIIAGISLGAYRRCKRPAERKGWNLQVIPSEHERRFDLKGIWRKVMSKAEAPFYDGVHLFLAHDREDERSSFDELKKRSYRALWLPRDMYRQYGQEQFGQALSELLVFEEEWRNSIRPTSDSPLLLPETVFSPHPNSTDLWNRARKVNTERDHIHHIVNAITRFRNQHWTKRCWLDRRQLTFRRGAPHGLHVPNWRRQKLTFRFPDGFHFDVQHERAHSFQLDSENGARIFKKYTNVDPHGYVRGGT